jgi:uncharacterized protein YceK
MRLLLPSFCLAVVLVLSGCGGVSDPTDPKTLAQCYATEFGQQPPAGVSNLKARQVIVGDAGGAWLRFVADSNVVAQIISSRFTSSDRAAFISDSGGGNTPAWWKPEDDSLADYYICSQWRSGTNYSVAVLACDAAHHVVYFHHGISF